MDESAVSIGIFFFKTSDDLTDIGFILGNHSFSGECKGKKIINHLWMEFISICVSDVKLSRLILFFKKYFDKCQTIKHK